MKIDVKIDDKEVLRNLGKLSGDMKKAMPLGLKDLVMAIANSAIRGSPFLTGNNRRSIRYDAKGLTGSIFSTSGYGGFLEIGTAVMAGRPYFQPAVNQWLPKFGDFIKERMRW